MKWYEQRFVNRRDWIIEHYEYFNFLPEEGLIIMAIDFLNSNQMEISYDLLAKKTNLKPAAIDNTLSSLASKGLLIIKTNSKGISFDLSPLFENDISNKVAVLNDNIFKIFEEQFGRLLRRDEIEKLNDLIRKYNEKNIIVALKKSIIYGKISMAYIETILRTDKENENESN